jgi:hypothetical protein
MLTQVLLQVYRTDLLKCEQTNATTNANGTASFPNGTLALYTLTPGTSCKDRTTGQAIRYAILLETLVHSCMVFLWLQDWLSNVAQGSLAAVDLAAAI